ncbi:sugar phosphate isomerase/epimerase [Puniceicoccaceae bacterium K14]|nr:sugar phosphate isomerase/epimerase [Puniceicoccaceae bacterium K14]
MSQGIVIEPGLSSHAYAWAIGLPHYLPTDPMSAYGLLDKAAGLGLRYVQIADNLPLERCYDWELRALKTYADRLGIEIQVGANTLTTKRLTQYLEIARLMETDLLRFVIDGNGYTPSNDEVKSMIRPVLPDLESAKVSLALENHDRFLCSDLVEIVESLGSENVGICLDTVNSMGASEGIETVMKKLGPLAVNFHVKEFAVERMDHKMGFQIFGRPLGQGQLPVAEVMNYLGPRCKTAILEQWAPLIEGDLERTIRQEREWATQSIEKLKDILSL